MIANQILVCGCLCECLALWKYYCPQDPELKLESASVCLPACVWPCVRVFVYIVFSMRHTSCVFSLVLIAYAFVFVVMIIYIYFLKIAQFLISVVLLILLVWCEITTKGSKRK